MILGSEDVTTTETDHILALLGGYVLVGEALISLPLNIVAQE